MSWMKDMAASEAAHTPKSWRVHPEDALAVVTADGHSIADVHNFEDAHLISAARDLLAVLIHLQYRNMHHGPDHRFPKHEQEMIDAAIAKATNRGEAAP